MGLFGRSNSTASTNSTFARRNDSVSSLSQGVPYASRASQDGHNDDEARRVFQRGWFGSSRAASGASTPRSASFSQDSASPSIPMRISSKDATTESDGSSHGRSDSMAKQLLFRGRKLKSSTSKLSISSLGSESTVQTTRSSKSRHRSDSRTSGSRSRAHSPSKSIGSPTAFQHMTHIDPGEYTKLKRTTEDDLVADFSVMRASQHQRRDFRGIKTVDIHSRNSSVETATTMSPSDRSSSQFSSTTSATSSTRSSVQNIDGTFTKTHMRKNRSQDSFSQPFVNGRPPKLAASPITAPPRTSSKRAATRYESIDQASRGPENLTIANSSSAPSEHQQAIPEDRRNANGNPEDAEESSDDEYKTSEPSSPVVPNTTWPLSSYGQALSVVNEEEQAAPVAPSNVRSPQHMRTKSKSRHALRSEPPSSGSSSEESSATVNAASLAQGMEQHGQMTSAVPPPSSFAKHDTPEKEASMKRSSINQGLFTSWSMDDADDKSDKQQRQEKVLTLEPETKQSHETAVRKPSAQEDDEELTALPSSQRSSMARSKSTKRSSKESDKSKSTHRSSTGRKSSHTSTTKHDRHASDPPPSSYKEAKPSKKRASAS